MPRLAQVQEQPQYTLPVGRDLASIVAHEGTHGEIFLDGEVGEDAAAFGHLHHAEPRDPMWADVDDAPPPESNVARPGPQQAADGMQDRRLAGAVGTDQGNDLRVLDGKRDALQRLDVAVEDVDGIDLEK